MEQASERGRVIIRPFESSDVGAIEQMHHKAGLPPICLPDTKCPLFFLKLVGTQDKRVINAGFIKLTGEAFILVDHETGTPEERWANLRSLVQVGLASAGAKGLQDVTAWLPPEVEKSFGKRIEDFGFHKSPWNSYSAILE